MKFEQFGEVQIPLSHEWRKIAISLSGGADSALLAMLLCSTIAGNGISIEIHVISHIRMWKTRPWQQHDSLRVYEWLKNNFPTIKFVRHTNFIAPDIEYGNTGPTITDEYGKRVSGDNAQIRAFSEFVCFHHGIDAYFNGVTKNPSGVSFAGMPSRDIAKTESNAHLEYTTHMGKIVSHPFRFIDKSWVIKQYKERGWISLLDITRSCEGEFPNLNYTNYSAGQYVPICNECFWCNERSWARYQNDI